MNSRAMFAGVMLDPDLCRRAMLARDARFDGRFFTAVISTGIYCRPICPARPPKPENCIFLPSAAAAQDAGFRPCLRCRPEAAPGGGAWSGTSATVARALRLIEAGALDDGGVEALAERLGVGGRHLRRLMMRHLGASPVAIAQTRRILLAKQLVHETSLSMAEVALASGFGSVRRFNEAFVELFGRNPTDLRRDRATTDNTHSGLTLSLGYRPPYDWQALLGFLKPRAIPGVEHVSGNAYRRAVAINEDRGWIKVVDEPERRRLRATIHFPNLAQLPAIVARLRRLFDLDAEPTVIGEALSQDPLMAPLVAPRPGLRLPGAWDGFELGVRAIAGQQITVAAATRLVGRIAFEFGEPLPGPNLSAGLSRTFPSARRLAEAEIGGMPRARAAAISGLAKAALKDPDLFEREVDLAASLGKLKQGSGVGEWTAQYIAMRALREPDAFPAGDVGLMRALAEGDRRPAPAEMLARAERWRPWRAYAAVHLWASLEARSGIASGGEAARAAAA